MTSELLELNENNIYIILFLSSSGPPKQKLAHPIAPIRLCRKGIWQYHTLLPHNTLLKVEDAPDRDGQVVYIGPLLYRLRIWLLPTESRGCLVDVDKDRIVGRAATSWKRNP